MVTSPCGKITDWPERTGSVEQQRGGRRGLGLLGRSGFARSGHLVVAAAADERRHAEAGIKRAGALDAHDANIALAEVGDQCGEARFVERKGGDVEKHRPAGEEAREPRTRASSSASQAESGACGASTSARNERPRRRREERGRAVTVISDWLTSRNCFATTRINGRLTSPTECAETGTRPWAPVSETSGLAKEQRPRQAAGARLFRDYGRRWRRLAGAVGAAKTNSSRGAIGTTRLTTADRDDSAASRHQVPATVA